MHEPVIKESAVRDVNFGENVVVVTPVNMYECSIGDNSFVGPFVEIQKGVRIGHRCKIQSHAFICELVTIGDDCFISHGAMVHQRYFCWRRPARDGKIMEIHGYRQQGIHRDNATVLPVTICDDGCDRGRVGRDQGHYEPRSVRGETPPARCEESMPMPVKFLDLYSQYLRYRTRWIAAIASVIKDRPQ